MIAQAQLHAPGLPDSYSTPSAEPEARTAGLCLGADLNQDQRSHFSSLRIHSDTVSIASRQIANTTTC